MSQKEKKTDFENTEKRESVRLDEHRRISVEDLKSGILHRVKMLNYSNTGLYFETDSVLQTGARIYIATDSSSEASLANEFECRPAEIVWRKRLNKSFYNYGYGVQFISPDDPQQKEQQNKKEVIDSRKHPRKPYCQPLLYAANDQILKGSSQNISNSGIFIQTKDKLEIGQTIILSLPTKTEKRLKIRAEVIWSNQEGCGVKFLKKMK
jgi:hypothetical protein